ncbi:hypothetical protein HNR46_003955 [Haloferula luteola]|uniref:MobA/VirD2-like nuclease domain-containing protein n=1 Tax=Haloferula luteola TaxID=595692 RepID=A0A840VDV9_9BACT|nr:relaxase/mobilization nuclease domain-containing protein [Haloferula luteola]MBB5353694.1 hypothetical protein [Haloferula luteola]
MVPFITKGGASFERAWRYFCHDKRASTSERVEWIEFRNLMTDDPARAWRMMEYTRQSAERLKARAGKRRGGKRVTHPCFSYSLSWHPDERPSREEMVSAAEDSLKRLGLEEHQAMIVCHTDEPHAHVHLVVNRHHPLTGMAATLSHSKRKLSRFASKYERRQGTIRCPRREENRRMLSSNRRKSDRRPEIGEAWAASADGPEFVDRLMRHGYTVADGGGRIVLVDPDGEIVNPLRHLPGVRAKDFRQVIEEAFSDGLPSAASLLKSNGFYYKKNSHLNSVMERKVT